MSREVYSYQDFLCFLFDDTPSEMKRAFTLLNRCCKIFGEDIMQKTLDDIKEASLHNRLDNLFFYVGFNSMSFAFEKISGLEPTDVLDEAFAEISSKNESMIFTEKFFAKKFKKPIQYQKLMRIIEKFNEFFQ